MPLAACRLGAVNRGLAFLAWRTRINRTLWPLLTLSLSLGFWRHTECTPFEAPDFPGNQPTIPGGATGPQIAEIVRNHTEQLREWREHMCDPRRLRWRWRCKFFYGHGSSMWYIVLVMVGG
jgi:hypothetical protein